MTFLAVLPDLTGPVTSPVISTVISPVFSMVLALAGGAPEPEDVKAGWTAFAIFLLLVAAVAFLGLSLVKHLRKAQAAQQAGAYGPDEDSAGKDSADGPAAGSDDGEPHRS
jgi:hypothetical protein